jgi:thiol:disulfide interchange protein DsbC
VKKVLEKRDDIVFYIKMFPLTAIHPEAYEKSKAIVCEESNEKALEMLEAALDRKPLPDPTCETDAIDKNIKLAARLGITGTPNVVFEDGKSVPGAMKSEDIIKKIDSIKK